MKLSQPTSLIYALILSGSLLAAHSASAEVFQAEDYSNYYDTTAGNTGGAYRSDNVDIEVTADTTGGYNVGWIESTEWLAYDNVFVATSGTYDVRVRVASPNGGTLSLDLNGGSIPLGELNISATGGWQSWQTVETQVQLEAGTHSLGVYAVTGGWNFNWIEVTPADTAPPPDEHHFEAEDYTNASDTTAGNIGGEYRTGDVDIETTADTGAGFNVGWIDSGEWLSFEGLDIPNAGNYQIQARVASPGGGSVAFDLNGGSTSLGELAIPATGGWQTWQTVTLDVNMPAGNHSFGVYVTTGGWNFNWVKVVPGGDGQNDPVDPNVVWSDEFDSIDTTVWNFETGGNGWGNNELQYYTNGSNASIEFDPQADSNVLVIEARQEAGGPCWWGSSCEYTSTRMNTRNNLSFQYGRMEARIKLPRAQGIWPAFWMLGDNFNTEGWPQGGELDIMEHVGTNNITSGALHGPGYSGNTPITGHLDHGGESIDSRYNLYAVEWDSNGMQWYINNVNFYSVTRAEVEQYGEWVYDQPFWFLLNVAVGGNWPGDPDHANYTTQRMYVDYVRVYQ